MKSKLSKVVVFCLISVVVLSLLTACTAPADETAPSSTEVTDQLGRTVKLDGIPQRIVSLAPSNTEILFALGLGDKVVGVTEYCDYPEAAKDIDKIGGFTTTNIEQVVALSPDLILATSLHEERIIPTLEEKELTVMALDPETIDEVLESIILVGEVTGKRNEASQLVAGMRSRIEAVTDQTDDLPEAQRLRVFYITWHDPLMTPGSGTRHNELIQMAGGVNIAQDLNGYAAITLEAIIEANPQVIVAGVGMGTGDDLPFQYADTEERLRNVDARVNDRVYSMDVDLCGRPGPRIIDALEKFAEFIHPELFGSE
jgi:iron complex transport system substrate-binding protein